MEVMVRCRLPDQPGRLARLAGAIGAAGGDIQAIEVVEADGRYALDDLYLVTGAHGLAAIVDGIAGLGDVQLVHAGPSRGQPGDAVTRLAMGLAALLSGAMTVEHALRALVGGLLHAGSVEVHDGSAAPDDDPLRLALRFGPSTVVVAREYPFTDTERARAHTVLDTCREAVRAAGAREPRQTTGRGGDERRQRP